MLKITTPVFHSTDRDPARLDKEEEGWIDPVEVCSIISGASEIPKIQDIRNKSVNVTGSILSVVGFRGGNSVLVMGSPAEVFGRIQVAVGGKTVELAVTDPT